MFEKKNNNKKKILILIIIEMVKKLFNIIDNMTIYLGYLIIFAFKFSYTKETKVKERKIITEDNFSIPKTNHWIALIIPLIITILIGLSALFSICLMLNCFEFPTSRSSKSKEQLTLKNLKTNDNPYVLND